MYKHELVLIWSENCHECARLTNCCASAIESYEEFEIKKHSNFSEIHLYSKHKEWHARARPTRYRKSFRFFFRLTFRFFLDSSAGQNHGLPGGARQEGQHHLAVLRRQRARVVHLVVSRATEIVKPIVVFIP